jgi:site-specific recombinase XerD
MTTTALVQVTEQVELARLVDAARGFATDAKAARTQDAYRGDWATFTAWCAGSNLVALPAAPATVALYITARAQQGRKVATLAREIVAISQAHKMAGQASPTGDAVVLETMKGIRRRLGVAQTQKTPVLVSDLRRMIATLPDGILGIRDAALLVLGFAGAFRRSEIVALDVADLEFTTEGLVVNLRRSKTDQEGAGRKIGLPYGGSPATCPVRTMKRWLEAGGVTTGPVFRGVDRHGNIAADRLSDKAVALVVKRAAEATGLDAAQFSGHSLRAGLATSAAKAGKSLTAIKKQTGHRSDRMVQRYIRDASLFDDNAAGGIGL